MRIFVINTRGIRRFSVVLKWVCISLVILSVVLYGVNELIYGEEYALAMQELSLNRVIIIDAGHGGEDPGAVGVDGCYEKDLNLAYALEIGALLEAEGYAVVYTRTEDKLLYREDENIRGIRKISDLKNRCKVAAQYENAIFVSIHMNSYSDPKYSGLQVYYSDKNARSREIASSIQMSVKSGIQTDNNRAIKVGAGMYVLENVSNPAVLIECGFLTNPEECKKLSEKEYRKQLSLSIVCGIIEYNKTLT